MPNITLLSESRNFLFNAKEIFDPDFVAFYSNLIHIICGISMFSTFLLTYIIIKKTPQFMSNLKVYLIPYCIYSFIIEFVFLTYTPIILHPFVYYYPTGIAKYFHPKLAIVFVAFGATAAISLVDCSIGTILERAFVLRNFEKLTNGLSNIFIPFLNLTIEIRIPFFIFVFLIFTCFCLFISLIVVTFVESFFTNFFVPVEEISKVVNSNIAGLKNFINLDILTVLQGADKNTVPLCITTVIIFSLVRVVIVSILIPYTAYKSYSLKIVMSSETKKSNLMLLKMCYLQFTGFFCFIGLPLLIFAFVFGLSTNPNKYINYCYLVMGCFPIYDSIITVLCIKPYRMFVFSFFKLPNFRTKQVIVVAQRS